MRRFILSLVALVITSVCFAQDVIVQKDGNTIQAKVLEVSQSEVKYKKFNNQNGPTYTVSTKDLQCINYENGTKDTFVSANYNPSIVTNETATQFSNDRQLLALYKPNRVGKAYKTAGWIVGGALFATGTALFLSHHDITGGGIDDTTAYIVSPIIAAAGIATWAGLYFTGKHIEKKYRNMVQSAPIYQQEFHVSNNDCLMVGVNMLKDNMRNSRTLGLGVSYNF